MALFKLGGRALGARFNRGMQEEIFHSFSDFRYKHIKYNRGKNHVFDHCSKIVQEECQKITGLTLEIIDVWDKVLRARSI